VAAESSSLRLFTLPTSFFSPTGHTDVKRARSAEVVLVFTISLVGLFGYF
jgi:hypothetical protein